MSEVEDPEYEDYLPREESCNKWLQSRTYRVNDTMTCVKCEDSHCSNCDQSQYYWCEDFYVSGQGECEQCHSSCKTCAGSGKDQCNICDTGEE
ncbi:unnamed protein product [Coregonus sp. 'balchen']|nr:unnamed protein product [Coregonus sp. 'balchen']